MLPRGHHLKLPMEKSQLRVSSWRKQFSCITSSMSSACGSGSQERQNQQMQVRYRGSLQFYGSRSAVQAWEEGEESWLQLSGTGTELRTTSASWTAGLLPQCKRKIFLYSLWYLVTILTSAVQQEKVCWLMHQFSPSFPIYNSLFSEDKTLEKVA